MKTCMNFLAIGCLLLSSSLALGMSSAINPDIIRREELLRREPEEAPRDMFMGDRKSPEYIAIADAIKKNDFTKVQKLVKALKRPKDQLNNGAGFGPTLLFLANKIGNKDMFIFLSVHGAIYDLPTLPAMN